MEKSSNNSNLVFITGVTGHLGSVLCKKLCECGYKCKGLVRDEDSKTLAMKEMGCSDVIVGDLVDCNPSDMVDWLKDCDFVIDAAGASMQSEIEQVEFIAGKKLFDAAVKSNVKKYICMSALGCDIIASGQTGKEQQLVCKTCSENPKYAKSQYKLDKYIQDQAPRNLDYLIVRCGDLTQESGCNKIMVAPNLSKKYHEKNCCVSRQDLANFIVAAMKSNNLTRTTLEVINSERDGVAPEEALKQINVAI
ncbi:hypothetical protein NAEGRDRAFT_57782 [Naegleria gruberi]|uniref:NAD(P)-binding domain-containing protein n=1 Tax=Naegleria gruberi TaxID=5762 RepID=D2VCC2_NAEGR|nr:uncharacterized protein NAEGRDRAFT_57782 [Naegleria gruberi]EFC45627.1 hypothetical protein NAEGRDRAFT_57782 [Naegleria gruberi]|eukprot:XP_002678371.1 hypothetical protein NAEGRDRAFT_57782 [Naegleria gruberi strain NEG-M]